MAEAWVRELRGEVFVSHSAGVNPSGLNPFAVQVMAEVGIDLRGQASVHIENVKLDQLDTVVSVCDHARETCPQLPDQVKLVHRPFDDPPELARTAQNEGEALGYYRRVRDEIRDYVVQFEVDA